MISLALTCAQNVPIVPVQEGGRTLYALSVGVGTPAQNQQVIVDTTTSDLWLISDTCPDKECANSTRFIAQQSSSYVVSNFTFKDSQKRGKWSSDLVGLNESEPIRIGFGLISEESQAIYPRFGIGRASAAQSPLQNSLSKNLLKSTPRIGLTLSRARSEVTFGGPSPRTPPISPVDVELMDDTTTYLAPPDSRNWAVQMTGIGTFTKTVQIHPTSNLNTTGQPALLSSVEPTIQLPEAVYLTLLPYLFGGLDSCQYNVSHNLFSCSRQKECRWLPDLVLKLQDHNQKEVSHLLKAEDYTEFTDTGCHILISRSSQIVLGIPFLARYFSVFDLTQDTIQLTSLKRVYPKAGKDVGADVVWWISVVGLAAWFVYFLRDRCCGNKRSLLDTDSSSSDDIMVDINTATDNSDPKTGSYSEL